MKKITLILGFGKYLVVSFRSQSIRAFIEGASRAGKKNQKTVLDSTKINQDFFLRQKLLDHFQKVKNQQCSFNQKRLPFPPFHTKSMKR
jgi:hypothetical protein